MVSYYNPAAMYRHQQQVSNSNFQSSPQMHTWYAAGYHQGAQMAAATAPPSAYCSVQEEQQLQAWHHHTHPGVFPHEFQDYMAMPPQQQQHNTQIEPADNNAPHHQLPSPPITVSGSEMSSPGAGSGHISPSNHTQNQRPPPVRSPYEWIKKTSYQSQPNPGKTRTKDKYRVVYTDHQRLELEREFTFNNKYITIRRKSELAANLGLSERQIKIWFQNRRAKERKQNKKRVEEKHDFNTAVYQQQQQQTF